MSDTEEREPSPEREKSEPPPAQEYKIFVGGISWHMDDRELKDTFKKYGAVDARVMLDRLTQRSRGFGFVHFDNKDDMDEAIKEQHNAEIDGRKISVTAAIPQDSIPAGTPAHALSRRGDRRRDYRDDRYPPRGGYDRYPPSRYDRYDRYGDYDRYERGYYGDAYGDRYGYSSDPYDRDPYYSSSSYSRSRDGYDRYESDRRGPDRYARSGGPERDYSRYSSRGGPYERSSLSGRP